MAKSHNTYSTDKRHSNTIRTVFILAIEHIRQNPHVLDVIHKRQSIQHKAEPNSNVEYTVPTAMYARLFSNDRTFPLETVQIKTQELKREEDIGEAIIHVGPYADEYARSVYTLAFTITNHIYFRNGAYKPETEEGRKLLAHELTHIAQNKDTEAYRNSTVEEKEAEAEAKEVQQEYNPDPEIVIKIKGKYKRIRKSKIKREISALAEMEVEKIQNEYAMISNEKKKLDYLINLETRLKRGEIKWLQ